MSQSICSTVLPEVPKPLGPGAAAIFGRKKNVGRGSKFGKQIGIPSTRNMETCLGKDFSSKDMGVKNDALILIRSKGKPIGL